MEDRAGVSRLNRLLLKSLTISPIAAIDDLVMNSRRGLIPFPTEVKPLLRLFYITFAGNRDQKHFVTPHYRTGPGAITIVVKSRLVR